MREHDVDPDDRDQSDESNNKDDSSSKDSHHGRDNENFGDRGDRSDRGLDRDNACHLDATGDRFISELSERATSSRDSSMDFLKSDTNSSATKENIRSDFSFDADLSTTEFKNKTNAVERAMAYACEQYDKMLQGMPSNMKDILGGVNGACKMVETRVDMINANNATPGMDKYFHCMGNCKAVEYGGLDGAKAALAMDTLKELKDVWKYGVQDSIDDFKANIDGLKGGFSGQRCHDACNSNLPLRYRDKL